MHSLDPTVLPIKRFFKSIIFFHVWQDTKKIPNFDRNTYYSHNFDVRFLPIHPIFPIYFYLPPPSCENSKKSQTRIYRIYIHARPISSPNFRSVIQAFTWARAWKEQSAGFRPFFVAKPVQGVRVCSVWIRGSPVSAGSRWKPLLKRSRRRWKSGIENWFQAGTELGGVARSGVADGGGRSALQPWWGKVGSDKWWFTVIVSPDRAFGEARSLRAASVDLSLSTQLIPRFVEPVYQTRLFGFYRDRSKL